MTFEQRREHAAKAQRRRDRLREAGLCINGPEHGPLVDGAKKCRRCLEVHRASNRTAVTP